MAIVGAGRGLGAAVARRFGREGFDIALIARDPGRVEALASELRDEGVAAQGYTANVRDAWSLTQTLDRVSQRQGLVEILQYSPLPQKSFLRPVLETTVEDATAAIEFSVYGPIAAVHQVVQDMRTLQRGTVLFVNGGTAVKPLPKFAGTSLSFAAQTAYGEIIREALEPDNIHVAQLIIPGSIEEGHPDKDPTVLAEKLWTIHSERGEFRTFATSMDAGD